MLSISLFQICFAYITNIFVKGKKWNTNHPLHTSIYMHAYIRYILGLYEENPKSNTLVRVKAHCTPLYSFKPFLNASLKLINVCFSYDYVNYDSIFICVCCSLASLARGGRLINQINQSTRVSMSTVVLIMDLYLVEIDSHTWLSCRFPLLTWVSFILPFRTHCWTVLHVTLGMLCSEKWTDLPVEDTLISLLIYMSPAPLPDCLNIEVNIQHSNFAPPQQVHMAEQCLVS